MHFKTLALILTSVLLFACSTTPKVSKLNCQPSLVNNGNGTITDTSTKLMWTTNDYFRENIASGKGWIAWADAMKTAKKVKFKGYDDWRVPSEKELMSIVNKKCMARGTAFFKSFPLLMSPMFANPTYPFFWTSKETKSNAVLVDFKTGTAKEVRKIAGNSVRFVRSIK